jgi:hypothetical protein
MSSSFQSGWIPNDSLQDSIESSLSSYKESKKAPTGKITSDDYLKSFSSALMEGLKSRDRNAAQEETAEIGRFGGSSGTGGLQNDLTIVHPGAPTILPGTPGKPGFGGVLGRIAGTALGFAVPGIGPALGMGLGGAVGDAFS